MDSIDISGTKIFLGTRVNIKWREVWYDGTVVKLGPMTDLVKISSVEDGYEYLMEPHQVKQNHSRFGEFQVAYNNGHSWINAVLINNSVTGAAKVRWRTDIHSDEKESWFEMDDIAPIVRNETYQLQDETIQASKSGLLPTRILDERPRTVDNVLYETDEELNEVDNGKNYESSEDDNEDHRQLPTLHEEGHYPAMWEPQHIMPQTMVAPPIFPQMPFMGMSKTKTNLSQTSIPCSWSYYRHIPKPSGGISHHYSSSFFMNVKTKKRFRHNGLHSETSTLMRSVRSEEYASQRRVRFPSISVKSEHHQPAKKSLVRASPKDSPKVSPKENINNEKTGRRHSLFNQFLLRKDSRMEMQLSLPGSVKQPKEDITPEESPNKPNILSASPDIVMAKASEHVLLTCTAISETPMTYTWQRNEEELPEAPNIKTPGEGILQIKNVTTEDAGTYTCTISNGDGNVQKSFRVLVQDQPAGGKRRASPQRKPQVKDTSKASPIPNTEVQSFLDSIVTEMEEFHDSLEDITLPSKPKPTVPTITITNGSSSSTIQTESSSSNNNPLSGDIEQYLEGYGGDDYGALSSTNIEKLPSKVRTTSSTKKQHHRETEEMNSIEVHTSLDSSEEKESLDNMDKPRLGLPSDEESISDQIERFQLSIRAKEEAEALLAKEPKSPRRWLGGFFSKKKKT